MAWWWLSINHGPGHQSHFDEYSWFDSEPADDVLEAAFLWHARDMHNSRGTWNRVDELPDDVRTQKFVTLLTELHHAVDALSRLGVSKKKISTMRTAITALSLAPDRQKR